MEILDKRLNLQELEERILQLWKEKKIYSLIRKKEEGKEIWRFIDGPPYTTGSIHLGTAWNKILKDYLIKYKRMRGFKVTDTPGYDTHGLPIEVQMEKELGFTNKQDIQEYGIDKFIKNCQEYAKKNIKIMNEQFKRLGCYFWDWDNPYITFKNSYIEGIWWTLKKAWEKGLLYQFYRPLNCCPRCATALAKHEHEYKNIIDTSLFLKIKSAEMDDTYFIIWTTTPWTLVANEAIMANPIAEYAKVKIEDLNEFWILSKASITHLISGELGYKYKIVEDYLGESLEGMKYVHPLIEEVPYQKDLENQSEKVHTIILSEEYVSASEGVGLVHSAPGHGPEDFEVGVANNIPVFNPVDIRGIYTHLAGKFEGKFVFDANEEILDLLKQKGTLILTNEVEHEYAHCWRCDSKLVYRATNQWFFKTESLIPELLKKNEEIYWVPKWAGNRWFKSWLSTLRDWCISRQRFWGVPLSVWICDNEDCGDIIVIGSRMELMEIAGRCPEDLHRPWIDEVTWSCKKCNNGLKKRIPDILDVWLDSGSVVWAAQEFYNEDLENFDSWIPADFILEGKDQIRGWFNSLLCSALVSSNRKNYNSCYMHGWTLRNKVKMSKSKGTQILPEDLIQGTIDELKKTKTYSNIKGIETFRFYSLGVTQPGRDFNFNVKEYADNYKILNTIWNVYVYANEKFNLAEFNPSKVDFNDKNLSRFDEWLISRTHSTIKRITELSDKFELPWITGTLRDLIVNDISRWYIMLNREKLEIYSEDPHKYHIMLILFNTLFIVLLMLAPINPMLSEEIFQKMFKPYSKLLKLKEDESIHLQEWPKFDVKKINIELESEMHFTRDLIENVRALKEKNKIRLRWPNKKIIIEPKEEMPNLTFSEIVKKIGNVRELEIKESVELAENLVKAESKHYNIYLDISLNDDLLAERVVSDLIRTIQFSRKKDKFKVGEIIKLSITTNKEYLKKYIEQNRMVISDKVTASNFKLNHDQFSKEVEGTFKRLNLCPNKNCSASLKDNIILKLKNKAEIKCPYCSSVLKMDKINNIDFSFSRID
ncbi:MAG: Isoleucine--tRNA ligase [Candidatus Lokiarchaeum sp. GC14_75]|nr:MAG: Isoleucine--tRNA ligase [Candidatus Lokiarchaeum sp. GC14_75]